MIDSNKATRARARIRAFGLVLIGLGLTACDDDSSGNDQGTGTSGTSGTTTSRPDTSPTDPTSADDGPLTDPTATSGTTTSSENPTEDSADSSASSDETGDPPEGVCPEGEDFGEPIPAGAEATRLADGFRGAEGVVWVASQDALYFSEIDRNRPDDVTWQDPRSAAIVRLDPASGAAETFVDRSGTNGLALAPDGQSLLAAAHDARAIASFSLADGARTLVADQIGDEPFNSPNDLTVRSDGHVYFTDPSWQLEGANAGMPAPGSTRVYHVTPGGEVSLVDDALTQPNGISLSPDEQSLYVTYVDADALAPNWTGIGRVQRYDVAGDGTTSNGAVFAELEGGFPDGMAIDCAGNVYVTVTTGVEVYDPDGQRLGTIPIVDGDERFGATNAAFGGADGQTLFLSVERGGDLPEDRVYAIFSVDLGIPGLPY